MHAKPPSSDQDRYDTELHCRACGRRLYLSAEGAATVLLELRQNGRVGLRCMCAAILVIGPDLLPVWPPASMTDD